MDGESAWGIKPGTWAEEVEAEEAKHGPLRDEEAFPTLGEAVKTTTGKAGGKGAKKSKPVKMSLTDFVSSSSRAPKSDKEILLALPKGSSGLPREERDPSALGGGFKDYGGNRDGFRGRREDGREEREPSRADASGDWGAERKFTPSDRGGDRGGFGGFRDREGGFGERRGFDERPRREDRPMSEADTVDDWGANRKFTPSDSARGGGGGGGGGFGGGFREREGGFRDRPHSFNEEPSRADAGDWGARRAPPPAEAAGPSSRRGYGFSEQPVSQADVEDRWSHRPQPAEPSGNAEPAAAPERPRLKLAPRTKPLDNPPPAAAPAANGVTAPSPPSSEAGSASSSGQQQQQKKSNPFGAARPREEVLKEKGIDYQKEELKLEHGEVIRDQTPEEADMEKEVEDLRIKLEGLKELTPGETDTINELATELDEKEKALYRLQAELDDKVRFSKNKPDRERSTDPVARSGSSAAAAAAAEGDAGFVEVRNARKERSSTTAAGQQQAEAPAEGREGSGAWARGGSFRDRDGGRGGGSFRDRDGGRGDRDREGRDRRPAGGPGRSGGW